MMASSVNSVSKAAPAGNYKALTWGNLVSEERVARYVHACHNG
jgi:hypothetical protein